MSIASDVCSTSSLQSTPSEPCPFHNGDPIRLIKGSYQGTVGTFLNLRTDPNWADIREPDASIRQHPVEWMALSVPAGA